MAEAKQVRFSIYLGEELVERVRLVRAAGFQVNVSQISQEALRTEIERLEARVASLALVEDRS